MMKYKKLNKQIDQIFDSELKKKLPILIHEVQSNKFTPESHETRVINRKNKNEHVFRGYFSLYRYSTNRDIPLLYIAIIAAVLSGACVPAMAIFFGKLANAMIMLHVIQTRGNGTEAPFCRDIINSRFNWKNPTVQMHDEFQNFFIIFSSLAGVYIILNTILFVCWSIPAEKQTVRWATEYVEGLLRKDMEWFDKNFGFEATSDVIENICLVRQGIGIQVPIAINLVSTFVFSLSCIVWRGYCSWVFIAISVMVVPFTGYLVQAIEAKTVEQSAIFTQSVIPVVTFSEHVFHRIQSIILHNGQKKELQYFKQKQRESMRMQILSILLLSFLNSVMALGFSVYFAMVLWQSVQLVWEDRTCHTIHSSGRFDAEVLFTVLGCVMFGMLNNWLLRSIYDSFVKAGVSGAKLAQIIDSEIPEPDAENNGVILRKIEGKIEFEDIGFAYPSKKIVPVLKGLSFSIKPGWKVGFVGVSGTGLSTIFKLFLLNYIPDCGFIRLDDFDIRSLGRKWYLGNVGYLTHDPLIFNDTIADNIRKGNPIATQEDIENACKLAEVHELILQLRNGYQTIAGENGELLSPQIRVQIALARVMLQKPRVLVLDEPTLTLDWQSSCTVERILDTVRENITTLLIPHRFHFLRNADMIFVISNGQVVEQGSHEELMKKEGTFYQMINQKDITPSKRLELAKINKVFLGKQLLPPFSFPKFWTNIGFPSITGVTITQLWLESKLATPTFGENSFDEETDGVKLPPLIPQPPTNNKSNLLTVDKVSSDMSWKKCINKEDKYYANPSSAYTPKTEEDVFCCWSVLRLTFSSLPCIIFGVIASCILGLMTPCYSYLLGKTIEILGKSSNADSMEECQKYAFYLLLMGLVTFIVVFIKTFVLELGSRRCFKKVQKHLFTSILRQEFNWFEQPENNSHALKTRLSRDVAGVKYIAKTFYDSVSHYSGAVIACTGLAIYLSPVFGGTCLFFVLLSIASTLIDAMLLSSIEEKRKKKIKLLRGLIAELCNKKQAVRALQLQPYFLNKLKSTVGNTYTSRTSMILIYVRGFTYGLSQGGAFLLYAFFIKLGSSYVVSKEVSFPTVIMIGHLLIVEMMKVGIAISMIPAVNNALVCGANILKITKRHPKIYLDKGHPKDIRGDIEFRNVHFWFESLPSVRVLKEITFRVNEGQTVAMVGVAGSGKSICLQLLLRLREAPLGTVEIDGEDIRNLNCVQLRKQIGLLVTESLNHDRTVREVIAYGDNSRQVDINEIIEAAQKANIHMLISSLPQGYDTLVGVSSLTLGQKRRLYLARMFLKNPKILLMEESSAGLDPESERKFLSSFERLRKGRTCLILAHRIRTVEVADYILVFHHGRIQERGTHNQLIASGGVYKQIYESQSATRSASLPHLSVASLLPSTGSLQARPTSSFDSFAENIVENISHGFTSLFGPLIGINKSTNK
ncbi:unnamed protein product [Allacma fusca]|uniref:Uncharacterized protein n=1 Tax=Allacma fusca TaxID=39272 RepID=A0A8J2J103_9HEXA|nr:unnamed protein product [Allacma fusca]